MDFLERLSGILGKQYLFKQDDGLYYNRYECCDMDKEEAEDWIFGKLMNEESASDMLIEVVCIVGSELLSDEDKIKELKEYLKI